MLAYPGNGNENRIVATKYTQEQEHFMCSSRRLYEVFGELSSLSNVLKIPMTLKHNLESL